MGLDSERKNILELYYQIQNCSKLKELDRLQVSLKSGIEKIPNYKSDHWEIYKLALNSWYLCKSKLESKRRESTTRLIAYAGFAMALVQTIIKFIEFYSNS